MSSGLIKCLLDHIAKKNLERSIRPASDCPKYKLKEVFTAKKGRVPKKLSSVFN